MRLISGADGAKCTAVYTAVAIILRWIVNTASRTISAFLAYRIFRLNC